MHRKTVATLKDSLPPKTEYIIYLDIRSVQREVYLSHLAVVSGAGAGGDQAPVMWALIRTLGLLLAHPLILERVLKQKLQGSGQPEKVEGSDFALLPHQAASTTLDALTAHQYADLKSSFKMLALFKIIEETTKLGENLLVFTQSIPSLDFIETICRQKKLAYKRLDGKTEVNKRQAQVKAFNEGSGGQVYLISTTAGGIGLNIYGASRVVIFDFQHSPVHEQQAIGRAYRIGQTRPVVVYWLICDGTFEKTLHNQQVFKNQLASRVVDKKNPLPKATSLRRYFAEPQQAEHQDTAAYLGRDAILDALLQSDVREGISSISTTETFEEEDTQVLEAEEIAQADELVLQISRRNNPAEESPIGIPQPTEQVRQISASPLTNSFDPVAVVPPALCYPQSVTGPATASTVIDADANFSTQPVPTYPITPGSNPYQHNMYQPGMAIQDLTQRVLARSDPFIGSGPRHQQLGATGAQVLARAAAESSMSPFTMDTARSRSAQVAAAGSKQPPVPLGLSPVQMGSMQNRPSAAAPDGITFRESMEPIGLGAMKSRPVASPRNKHNVMGDFREELTRQASFPLKQEVPALVEQINKYIKGGGLVQNSTWVKLKALIQGRQDRADAILNGAVPAQTLAMAGDPKAGLENLLDGRSSVLQSQDVRRMKDPDVGDPF